jgi:hypothetical protein
MPAWPSGHSEGATLSKRPSAGRLAVALWAGTSLAACTSSSSVNETSGSLLPRPQVVVVETFAVAPDEVQLDRGLSTQIDQAIQASRGTPRSAQETVAGRQVAGTLAKKLVVEIQDLGLPAQLGTEAPPGAQPALLITGQFVSIDEGNRTERVAIGLGAGRSDVRARAQVFEVVAGSRRLLEEVEVDAKSGLKPGMAETLGVGGVAGHLAVSAVAGAGLAVVSETMGANVVADSDRAAKGIAKQLATFFARQGWTQ